MRSPPAASWRAKASETMDAFAVTASPTGTVLSDTPGGRAVSCAWSQPDFWKSETRMISRRGRPEDSSRPAAARNAGPYLVAPAPGVARSIAAARAARSDAARTPTSTSEPKNATVPRSAGPSSPTAAVAAACARAQTPPYPMLYEVSSRMTTSRPAPAAAAAPAPGQNGRAKARASSANAAMRRRSSGQWRMARRLTDWFGILRRNIRDGNSTTRRRSRCTRCTTIGIAIAARAASSAGARNDITAPASSARGWRGSGRARDRAGPTC